MDGTPGREGQMLGDAKKLRNRLSQRAYRARQNHRIKQLERMLDSTSATDSQALFDLKAENQELRNRLLLCQQTIQSLSMKMHNLSQSTADFLWSTSPETDRDQPRTASRASSRHAPEHPAPTVGSAQATPSQQIHLPLAKQSPLISSPLSQPQLCRLDYMGFEAYSKIMDSGPVLLRGPVGCLRRTNSPFSDHLSAVEFSFGNELVKPEVKGSLQVLSLTKAVNFMFSMFINMAWEHGIAFFTFTQAYRAVAPILNYRINPTAENYLRIVDNYRPTRLQMSVSYPCIIDWMPWPSMRERLILHHSTNPHLDQVVVDVGCGFCVQVDLSEYVAGIEPVIGHLRVWDLVTAMAPSERPKSVVNEDGLLDDTAVQVLSDDDDEVPWVDPLQDEPCDEDRTCDLPAPSAEVLFESRSFALRAFKKLIKVGERMLEFNMIPSFFEKYPELFDPSHNYIAYGPRLQPRVPYDPVKSPPDANHDSMLRYVQLTSLAIRAISEKSSPTSAE